MSLCQTIRPLLLAPVGAIVVFTLITLPRALSVSTASPGAPSENLVQLLLIYWLFTALVCYASELLFVVPVLILWRVSRQPSVLLGAIWGVLVSCCVVAMVTFVLPGAGPTSGGSFWLVRNIEGVLGRGACGLASGVAYSLMSRMQAVRNS
jgi:membrane protease YdiL (CAAX protease family)